MYLEKCREPLCVVPSKVAVECLVGVETEELSYDLDGEDLGIRELGCGSATSDAAPFETVVDEAEDGHDEGALRSIRRRPPLRLVLLGQHRA